MIREHKINIDFDKYSIEFIKKLTSLFQELNVAKEYKLTDKEIHFFSALVYLVNNGFTLSGNQFTEEMIKLVHGITKKNRGVYIYKKILREKKWIIIKGKNILLPPVFMNKDSVRLSITLNNEGDKKLLEG